MTTVAPTNRYAKYRYRLCELANKAKSLPSFGKLTIGVQAALLEQHYGIPTSVFHYDRFLLLENPEKQATENRLRIYAHFFNVTEDQLRNAPTPSGPTLAEIVYKAERRNGGLPLAEPVLMDTKLVA